MKTFKHLFVVFTLILITFSSSIRAQQVPCELDTSHAIADRNFEVLSESYTLEPPTDTFWIDTTNLPTDSVLPELEDSTRHVVWIHGLGGNSTAWSNMANAFNRASVHHPELSRKIISTRVDYGIDENSSTTYSIGQNLYDNEVPTEMEEDLNPDYDPERTILIAHSQGGIVARQMDRYKSSPGIENNFGGFATFGAPNQGAQIINNQNMVNAFLFDMADNLLEGPFSDLEYHENFWIRMIADFANTPAIKDTIVDFFADDIGEYLINESYPKTTEDFSVGAPELTELNNYASESIEIVPFFSRAKLLNSVEHESVIKTYEFEIETPLWCPLPICWEIVIEEKTELVNMDIPVPISLRTLNYFVTSPSEMDDFTAQDSFYNFAIDYHETLLDYQANVDRNDGILNCADCLLVGPPGVNAKRAKERKRAWQKGVDFLNSFDRRYRALTGILKPEFVAETEYYCDCTEFTGGEDIEWTLGPFDEPVDCTEEEGPNIICSSRERHVGRNHYENIPSDGVVLEESAMEIPQASYEPVEILPDLDDAHLGGATHMELRNTSYTRDQLDKLFKGEYGKYFFTPKYF